MFSIVKKLFALLALFLITPIVALCLNWYWQPSAINDFSTILLWLTHTADSRWAILTCLFFWLILCYILKFRQFAQCLVLGIILAGAMLLGQGIKSIVKNYISESRPFVLWIEKKYAIEDHYFYSLPRSERRELINIHLKDSNEIPQWLRQYWRTETGYSFPSGHTVFATTWAYITMLLIGFRRHYLLTSMVICWAVFIEISRLSLGMHHPIDLILGILLGFLVALLTSFCTKRWHIVE